VDTSSPQTGGYLQLLLLLALIIPAIFFMLTQQNTLKALKPESRLMKPGLVWLQIIPLFGQVWQFFVVTRIADSIKKELSSPQDDSILGFSDAAAFEDQGQRPTYAIGMTYCILYTGGFAINVIFTTNARNVGLISMIVAFSTLAGMICWIVYWVQLAQYKRKLKRLAVY
jgi:hypothetical protein